MMAKRGGLTRSNWTIVRKKSVQAKNNRRRVNTATLVLSAVGARTHHIGKRCHLSHLEHDRHGRIFAIFVGGGTIRTRHVKQEVNLLRVVDALNLDIPIPMWIVPRRTRGTREGDFVHFDGFPFVGIAIQFRRVVRGITLDDRRFDGRGAGGSGGRRCLADDNGILLGIFRRRIRGGIICHYRLGAFRFYGDSQQSK